LTIRPKLTITRVFRDELTSRLIDNSTEVVPHSRPWITAADARAVARVIQSGKLAQGPEVAAFEGEVGALLELPPGVAVSSGTAALHLALLGLGIGPADEVILPSYLCVAPLHAIQYVGATPRLADVDPRTYNLDPLDVRRRITRRTRAIIVPHSFGLPADLDELQAPGVPLIEDCAQAFGARFRGRAVGTFGTVSVVSFYATKLLTTGEGGMVLSRDRRLLARARDQRDYDERRRPAVRYNYKVTDFQAALGRSQLRRFPAMLARRTAIAARYRRRWARLPVTLPYLDADRIHVYHRFVIGVPTRASAAARRLAAAGVNARLPVFRPIHITLGAKGFPGTEEAFRHALSVPLYPALTLREEARVIRSLERLFG
jgi:dTDP-4-amino-4,6-dideoxygalactose transaminase